MKKKFSEPSNFRSTCINLWAYTFHIILSLNFLAARPVVRHLHRADHLLFMRKSTRMYTPTCVTCVARALDRRVTSNSTKRDTTTSRNSSVEKRTVPWHSALKVSPLCLHDVQYCRFLILPEYLILWFNCFPTNRENIKSLMSNFY